MSTIPASHDSKQIQTPQTNFPQVPPPTRCSAEDGCSIKTHLSSSSTPHPWQNYPSNPLSNRTIDPSCSAVPQSRSIINSILQEISPTCLRRALATLPFLIPRTWSREQPKPVEVAHLAFSIVELHFDSVAGADGIVAPDVGAAGENEGAVGFV